MFLYLIFLIVSEPARVQTGAELQSAISCGPRSVSLAFSLSGRSVDRSELANAFRAETGFADEYSVEDIARAVRRLGGAPHQRQHSGSDPQLLDQPLIAPVRRPAEAPNPNHFVVLYGRRGDYIQMLDYPSHPRWVPIGSLAQVWDGYGIYVTRDDRVFGLQTVRAFAGWTALGSAIVAVMSLSVLLNAFRGPPPGKRI